MRCLGTARRASLAWKMLKSKVCSILSSSVKAKQLYCTFLHQVLNPSWCTRLTTLQVLLSRQLVSTSATPVDSRPPLFLNTSTSTYPFLVIFQTCSCRCDPISRAAVQTNMGPVYRRRDLVCALLAPSIQKFAFLVLFISDIVPSLKSSILRGCVYQPLELQPVHGYTRSACKSRLQWPASSIKALANLLPYSSNACFAMRRLRWWIALISRPEAMTPPSQRRADRSGIRCAGNRLHTPCCSYRTAQCHLWSHTAVVRSLSLTRVQTSILLRGRAVAVHVLF